jgi:large conductance mechanosensitive channel
MSLTLRQRMHQDLQLAGLAEGTQTAYLRPGQQGYLGWKWVIDGKEVPYGLFLGEVVNFLIVSLALFLFIVKFLGWVLKVKQKEEAAPPSLTKDQELLTEIRDLLKDGRA